MKNRISLKILFAAAGLLVLAALSISNFRPELHEAFPDSGNAFAAEGEALRERKLRALEEYGKLPISFEPNVGQTDEKVDFLARGKGYALFLNGGEAVLSLRDPATAQPGRAVVRMAIEGADRDAKGTGVEGLEGRTNYLTGNDPGGWSTDVPNFRKVRFSEVYEGIDVVYYGNNRELEYDFVVSPGADPESIRLRYSGIEEAKIDERSGDLLLKTAVGDVRQKRPFVYQLEDGSQKEIASNYRLENESNEAVVSFRLADFDRSKDLVIDPILVYGSYLGGSEFDEARGIAVDAEDNAYIVGTAASIDYPTTQGTLKPEILPRSGSTTSFWYDAFVTKMNPDGTALVFSTYYGGREGNESGKDIRVDADGSVVFTGTTMSSDLPTVNAFQASFGGTDDVFAAKLSADGSALVYSTYLGGNNTDSGGSVSIEASTGDAVFAGRAGSPNFPTTPGAYKQRLCDSPQSCSGVFYSGSYVVRLDASGTAVFSTLFDAGINTSTVDQNGNAVVAGTAPSSFPTTPGAYQPSSTGGIEGFIAKLDPTGSSIVYGTFLGGGTQSDRATAVALDAAQNIYVTGQTQNTGFPTTEGAFDRTYNGGEDAFVTKLNPEGSALVFSTFLGGSGKDEAFGIGIAADGGVFVTGETNVPSTFPLRNSLTGSTGRIYLTRLAPDASALVFSTMLGDGGAYALTVDQADNAYITGHAYTVPVTPDAFQTIRGGGSATSPKDAFILKIGPEDENETRYSISGSVTDQNNGFNNDYSAIVVTVTGTVNRSISLPYNGGQYFFGRLPSGGDYTVKVKKVGYDTDPESAVFSNLGANQFADFTILRNRAAEGVITTPQHGQTFDAPATINIEATASDPDGHSIAKVDFVAYSDATGGVPIGTDSEAPYTASWQNVPVGTWSLYAIPTDEKGLRGVSTETVHIFVVDPAPMSVSFTSPEEGQHFEQGGYVPISVAVTGPVRSVDVRDQNGNRVAWLANGGWSSEWRAMQAGDFTLTATASDAQGNQTVSDSVDLVIDPINHDISGRILDSLTFQPVEGVVLSLVSTTNPEITANTTTDSSGNYSFSNLGTTPEDGIRITPSKAGYTFDPVDRGIGWLGYIDWTNQNFSAIEDNPVTVSMTSPTPGTSFPANPTVTLSADASTTEGTISKVEFFDYSNTGNHVLLFTDTEAPYSFDWKSVPGGNQSVFAVATNSNGRFNRSSNVAFHVQEQQTTVRLQGDIRDSNGNPMRGITVRLTGSQTATSTTNIFGAYGFFNLPAGGDYTITPQPTGATTYSPPSFSVTNATTDNSKIDFVASTVNQPPTVQFTSPSDGGVYTIPDAVRVAANATDADGSVSHLTVTATDGTFSNTIGQSNNGTLDVLWQPSTPGSYTLTATATDNGGLRTSVQLSITVNAPPPVMISGRIVDRNSVGIEGVALLLKRVDNGETASTGTTDASGNYEIPNVQTFQSYVLTAEKMNYTFSPNKRNYFAISTDQTGDFTGTLQIQPSDFDGDGESDLAVWRPSNGVWHVTNSRDGSYSPTQFGGGAYGDIPVPGNYDGDENTDHAVYRNGTWYIYRSSDRSMEVHQLGTALDKPIQGDFDGDGKTDIAVWRPENGVWYIRRSSDGSYDYRQFGANGDQPVSGDFDGDGKSDPAVWRASTGVWYVLRSTDGDFRAYQFGSQGDIPLTGDFDGDNMSDSVIFRPSNGTWYILKSSTWTMTGIPWGVATDVPIPGDFDRDGKTDIGVFRPSEGNWYVLKSSDGGVVIRNFGVGGDIPVPAAYSR
ncbi:MAG: carboxypeptidase regulatory-like domain-containing protein [Aridibacter famidurans]|nr:carboxypeptidase regulatory-like domain-containing protein [Aridibacter famidurans]